MGKACWPRPSWARCAPPFRSLAGADASPAAVLVGLDRLHSMLEVDEIATVAYVLLDLESCVARVARAGHLPPILVDPDGRPVLLEEGGSPRWAPHAPERTEAEVDIRPGSILVLYTDGIVEDRATGLDGLEAFVDLVAENATSKRADVEALATELLLRTSATSRQDDIALLVARLEGMSGSRAPVSERAPALSEPGPGVDTDASHARHGFLVRNGPARNRRPRTRRRRARRPRSRDTPHGSLQVGRSTPTAAEYVWVFPEVPQTAAAVRRHIRKSGRSLPAHLREDILLLASELVTNAVRHGGGEVTVRLWPDRRPSESRSPTRTRTGRSPPTAAPMPRRVGACSSSAPWPRDGDLHRCGTALGRPSGSRSTAEQTSVRCPPWQTRAAVELADGRYAWPVFRPGRAGASRPARIASSWIACAPTGAHRGGRPGAGIRDGSPDRADDGAADDLDRRGDPRARRRAGRHPRRRARRPGSGRGSFPI